MVSPWLGPYTWSANYAVRYGEVMPSQFLSDEWFSQVDTLIAEAGDLHIPDAMKAVEVNVTITAPTGDIPVSIKEGAMTRGHRPSAVTSLTLNAGLARKIFVDGDAAAGVQAFLTGEIKAEGDLSKLVAMQTVEPSDAQKQLTRRIAAMTA